MSATNKVLKTDRSNGGHPINQFKIVPEAALSRIARVDSHIISSSVYCKYMENEVQRPDSLLLL